MNVSELQASTVRTWKLSNLSTPKTDTNFLEYLILRASCPLVGRYP